MKRKTKMKIIFLISVINLVFISVYSNNVYRSLTNYMNTSSKVKLFYLKDSAYTDLTGSPILIDETLPNNNWSHTALTYDWCSGNGTWSDPYVIESVTIDGNNTGSCITIKASSAPFIIKNSILYNAGSVLSDSGIQLYNTTNGQIFNNSINSNNRYGILCIFYSENNTIFENRIEDNVETGIEMVISDDNTVYKNCFINNSVNALDDGTNNKWDNGSIGNYWDDYASNGGFDRNGDGIGDVPYNITGSAGSKDEYPLMRCPFIPVSGPKEYTDLINTIVYIFIGVSIGAVVIIFIQLKRTVYKDVFK